VDREARRGGAEEPARVGADESWRELQVTRAMVGSLEGELRALRESVDRLQGSVPDACEIGRSLEALRRACQRPAGAGAGPDPGMDHAGRLLRAGLSPEHALPIAADAARRAQPEDALARALAARLDARLVPPRPEAAGGVDLLVGATGVGKTTTVAKLAGFGGRDARAVAIATTDVHRLGGEEILRSYTKRLGLRFSLAATPEDLRRSREKAGRRHLLVDTAGRGPNDPGSIAELARFREALGPGVRVQLVLSATTKEQDLVDQLARHRPLRPDGLVVTHLDESRDLGNVANLLLAPDSPPLTWLAAGQAVPTDLEVPDPDRLSARILAGAEAA
jgi:flagellar biosynthesis protein FlhF